AGVERSPFYRKGVGRKRDIVAVYKYGTDVYTKRVSCKSHFKRGCAAGQKTAGCRLADSEFRTSRHLNSERVKGKRFVSGIFNGKLLRDWHTADFARRELCAENSLGVGTKGNDVAFSTGNLVAQRARSDSFFDNN